jgi:hypothetical protein
MRGRGDRWVLLLTALLACGDQAVVVRRQSAAAPEPRPPDPISTEAMSAWPAGDGSALPLTFDVK